MEFSTVLDSLASFGQICALVEESDINDIIDAVAQGTGSRYITRVPPGRVTDKTDKHYGFVLNDLKENLLHYRWVYERLIEPRSKQVFLDIIRNRIVPNRRFLISACDKAHDQYFDPEIVQCKKDEVFVDCGGFIGDTVESFVKNCKAYQRIYTYEPSAENLAPLRQAVEKYANVVVKPFGVGKKEQTASFTQAGAAGSFVIGGGQNVSDVKIVALDEDIAEPVSFIKMDVEGCEIDALLGCVRHIRNESPKLAICVYHLPSDIWEVPRLIDAINPNYDFFLRHYCDYESWETVLYAVPKAPVSHTKAWEEKAQPGVYAINGYYGFWTNRELTKDCGMAPFMFHKKYGFKAVMVGSKAMEYPNLETCVKGLAMDFTSDRSVEARCAYVAKHYRDMDVLMLYGPYPQYYAILETYRQLRPDGKVYLALDANSAWMDKIRWNEPDFLAFMSRCDVIATSCKRLQKHLSIKWPFKIAYIPNGFYNYLGSDIDADLSEKQNVILTVGRLGTVQKNTGLLLEAFALVSEKIPGWSLKLVGSVEEPFREYINRYFERNPHLADRVIFTGDIEDKQALFSEYKRAKIFALTSVCEGGNPNAVAEALYYGCYIVTSNVDASEDITGGGSCGKVFPIGDVKQLTQILAEVCCDDALTAQGARCAIEYARRAYSFDNIAGRLHYLLFGKE